MSKVSNIKAKKAAFTLSFPPKNVVDHDLAKITQIEGCYRKLDKIMAD